MVDKWSAKLGGGHRRVFLCPCFPALASVPQPGVWGICSSALITGKVKSS